jgi:hypothetical protein
VIVYPQALILSAAAAGMPLTHARIGWHTYTRTLDDGDVTASSSTTEGPKDAPLRPDTAEFWQASALPATWTLDLGTLSDVDYVGIAGHTIGSEGGAIKVETSTNTFSGSPLEEVWTTFANQIAPADDAPILFLDDSRSVRKVRLTLTGAGTVPRIAVVYAGEVLAMQRMIYGGHTPITLSRQTVLYRALSRGGQFLGQGIRRLGVQGTAHFRHLTSDWYRANFDPFVKAARQYPYFFAWRPEDFPLEVAYAWTPDDIAPVNMGVRNFMEVGWSMTGIGNE